MGEGRVPFWEQGGGDWLPLSFQNSARGARAEEVVMEGTQGPRLSSLMPAGMGLPWLFPAFLPLTHPSPGG